MNIPKNSDGRLRWLETHGGEELVMTTCPCCRQASRKFSQTVIRFEANDLAAWKAVIDAENEEDFWSSIGDARMIFVLCFFMVAAYVASFSFRHKWVVLQDPFVTATFLFLALLMGPLVILSFRSIEMHEKRRSEARVNKKLILAKYRIGVDPDRIGTIENPRTPFILLPREESH